MSAQHVRILGVITRRGSGLAKLWVAPLGKPEFTPRHVPMDAGPGLRAIRDLYGSVEDAKGQEAYISTDHLGVLTSISRPKDQQLDPQVH